MSTTANRKYPYPSPTGDGADVSYWMQRLAEAVDTDVNGIASSENLIPLPGAGGWSVTGGIEKMTIGKRIQVSYALQVVRTGAAFAYNSSATFANLGALLPAEVRSSVWPIYTAVVVSGAVMNVLIQGVVDPSVGTVGFRHTANFSIPTNATLFFYGTYSYAGA